LSAGLIYHFGEKYAIESRRIFAKKKLFFQAAYTSRESTAFTDGFFALLLQLRFVLW